MVSAALLLGNEYTNRGGSFFLGDVKGLGGFSQYTLADEQLCFKIPPGLTYTESATVPLAACTAWLALFSKSCLNIRQQQGSDISILIWVALVRHHIKITFMDTLEYLRLTHF